MRWWISLCSTAKFLLPNIIITVSIVRWRQYNFWCTGSQENFFGSVGQQNNNYNLRFKFDKYKNDNANHWGKETSAMFSLLIQNKNSAINASLPFLFNYFELKEK